ncbi:MAG: hypothetical protein JW927_07720 [Deltaproteobacteria bacterium]|nr:hypothetical protein [Deltaproteobacteria bacterium]
MIYFLQIIFPYIVFFYLFDCFVNVKGFQIIFQSHFGGKYKLKRKGIRFIGISPFCMLFNAVNFPFYLTKDGICLWNKDNLEEHDLYEQKYFDWISYKDIEKTECDGSNLILNGNRKLPFNTFHAADFFRKKINDLKKNPKGPGEQIINELYENPEPVNHIISKNRFLFLEIQYLGAVLFIYTFLILPGFLYSDFPLKFNALVIILASCFVLIVGISCYAHRKTGNPREKNILFTLSMIFSPISTIHAMHLITKDMALNLDWLIPASCLLSPDAFKDILIKEIKRIRYSKEKIHESSLDSFLLYKEKIYLSLLEKAGIKQDDIFKTRQSNDSIARCCCPFCGAEFMEEIEICPDCSIPVEMYEDTVTLKE